MSTMAERIAAAKSVRPQARVYVWFDSLNAVDSESVRTMALDAEWTDAAVMRIVVAEGVRVSKETIAE